MRPLGLSDGQWGKFGRIRCHVAFGGGYDRGLRKLLSGPVRRFRLPCGRGHEGRELKMKTFLKMLRDESGASAAEYALILAIVGAGIALAAVTLGGAITTAMNNASECISDESAACRS